MTDAVSEKRRGLSVQHRVLFLLLIILLAITVAANTTPTSQWAVDRPHVISFLEEVYAEASRQHEITGRMPEAMEELETLRLLQKVDGESLVVQLRPYFYEVRLREDWDYYWEYEEDLGGWLHLDRVRGPQSDSFTMVDERFLLLKNGSIAYHRGVSDDIEWGILGIFAATALLTPWLLWPRDRQKP